MISYAQALRRLSRQARPLPEETVELSKALGRVTARAIESNEALPAFDNSSMDGFAIDGNGANRLPVSGTLAAGDRPRALPRGTACEIMTGGVLPRGADRVVPVEFSRREGGAVLLDKRGAPGDYVRRAGSDFAKGQTIVAAGTALEPRHLLALAALGLAKVRVRARARVSILATGKELVSPGRRPKPGQIRDGSSSFLMAALVQGGCEARFHGIVRDDPADFKRRLKVILASKPDLVLTTGAVSMGKHDFVTNAVQEAGARLLYHKVAIRPGKPGLAAAFPGGPLFIGLPGNPVSTVVGLRFFVLPFLRPQPPPVRMRLTSAVPKPDGLRCFFKARREGLRVRVLAGQGSHQISPLLAADCWAVLPEKGARVRAGTEVEVHPL